MDLSFSLMNSLHERNFGKDIFFKTQIVLNQSKNVHTNFKKITLEMMWRKNLKHLEDRTNKHNSHTTNQHDNQ